VQPGLGSEVELVTYNVVLFAHVLGVVMLFAAFSVMQLGGARLRRAGSTEQARLWLGLLAVTGPMFAVAFLLILAGGLYMTVDVWSFSTPWIDVALVTVGIMLAVGNGVVGRGLSKMGKMAAAAPDGPLSPELRAAIEDRALWTSSFVLTGFGVGVLWLMTNKPGWTESILVVLGVGLIGAVLGSAATRRKTTTAKT
jgi:small-conductance mechanosensitive channel